MFCDEMGCKDTNLNSIFKIACISMCYKFGTLFATQRERDKEIIYFIRQNTHFIHFAMNRLSESDIFITFAADLILLQ